MPDSAKKSGHAWSGFQGNRYDLVTNLPSIPDGPGVYAFKDDLGQVIYVGKAKNLRSRLRSYFAASLEPKTEALMQRVNGLDTIAVSSEVEALILEANLIKKYRPKYNILLRDDKQYPYIRVGVNDSWPRPSMVRRSAKDGARYFGPFTRASSVRETLSLLRRIFPYRTCTDRTLAQTSRPCLDYHIGRCLGPCTGTLSEKEYRETIDEVIKFLEGRHKEVRKSLEKRMNALSENLEFERAAKVRDQLRALDDVAQKQTVVLGDHKDRDVLGLARTADMAFVSLLLVRGGVLLGRESFVLSGVSSEEDDDVISAFISQYYSKAAFVPNEVLVPCVLEDCQELQSFLSQRKNSIGQKNASVKIKRPVRGKMKDLMLLAEDNAKIIMTEFVPKHRRQQEAVELAMSELKEVLGLPTIPRRIECYDISNISGRQAVASMVVAKDGIPNKSSYRRFKIKVEGKPNDFAMMQEVLWRRFKRGLAQKKTAKETGKAGKFAEFPDLILVDGGKGQVSAAKKVLDELGLNLPLAGLAEKEEHIFLPGESEPVILPRDSGGLYLVMRLRDEAHRFAISYHRNLRQKQATHSRLLEIPGIGPKKAKTLLQAFPDIDSIKRASVEEISKVHGIGTTLATVIKSHL